MFLFHVRKYRKDDIAKFIEEKRHFDRQLERSNYICEDTKNLLPHVVTHIIKDPGIDLQNTEKIINVTSERNTEIVDEINRAADKELEEVFKELINI